jgi:hypothetical protein
LIGADFFHFRVDVEVGNGDHVLDDYFFLPETQLSELPGIKLMLGFNLRKPLLDDGCKHNELIILIGSLTIQ